MGAEFEAESGDVWMGRLLVWKTSEVCRWGR